MRRVPYEGMDFAMIARRRNAWHTLTSLAAVLGVLCASDARATHKATLRPEPSVLRTDPASCATEMTCCTEVEGTATGDLCVPTADASCCCSEPVDPAPRPESDSRSTLVQVKGKTDFGSHATSLIHTVTITPTVLVAAHLSGPFTSNRPIFLLNACFRC